MLLMQTTLAAAAATQPVPIKLVGPWQVQVGPGKARLPDGRELNIVQTVVKIPPQAPVTVTGETHDRLPVYMSRKGYPGWRRGARLRALITQECSAAGALIAESVRVFAPSRRTEFARDKDWRVEDYWATIGRVEGGAITADAPVEIDYQYYPNRIHSIVAGASGEVGVVEGNPGLGAQLPPPLADDQVVLANVWLSGDVTALSEDNLFPVSNEPPPRSEWSGAAGDRCPKVMAKLRAGGQVSIVAWGDSVTHGGGVGGDRAKWYQNIFLARLRRRFPQASITLKTAAWPGGNSLGYMNAPRGGQYDFQRDVLDPKPDLVTIEFVNDAGWRGDRLRNHYARILDILRNNGSEVILITPHFVRPDWMGLQHGKVTADPRPYVRDLKAFARETGTPVADASLLWCHLWRRGIPYMSLLANSINHPDERGHALFADALMDLFPDPGSAPRNTSQ